MVCSTCWRSEVTSDNIQIAAIPTTDVEIPVSITLQIEGGSTLPIPIAVRMTNISTGNILKNTLRIYDANVAFVAWQIYAIAIMTLNISKTQ